MKINWEESPTLNTCHQTRYAPLKKLMFISMFRMWIKNSPNHTTLILARFTSFSRQMLRGMSSQQNVTDMCLPPLSKKKGFPSSSQDQGLFFHFLWAVVMGSHAESQNHKLDQAGREWSGSFQPTSQVNNGLPRVHCTGLWLDGSWASSVSDTPQPLWSVPVLHHLHSKDVLPNSLSIHFKHNLCALKYTFRREPRKKHNLF